MRDVDLVRETDLEYARLELGDLSNFLLDTRDLPCTRSCISN
jgi:hypothetical protein